MDNPYPICENCIFVNEPLDKDPCQECNRAFLAQRIKPNFASKRKPQTNGDRIRTMTDEELAKWLSCPGRKKDMFPNLELYIAPSREEWLDWLRQEVADE